MNDEYDTMDGMRTVGGFDRAGDVTLSGGETQGGGGMTVLAGRYRVVRRLGEGGMGSVWLAEDLKLDGKQFAIKMLPSVLAGKKGAYRQVKAEALMAMKLAHPNIAIVRAFEEDEGGNPFLVMDYIDGEPLDDILAERGPLSEEETVRLLGPVAAALDYAHSQGVVHRDVKPGNVMVRKDGTPFVLDFGIAREIQETLTRVTGKLSSGTLLYMSPEQLHGRSPKAAQDVYSFAAMAYECLAGSPPFSRGQIEYQIDHDAPEELPAGVSPALRKGVMAGLAKEAGDRPGSCAAVLGGRDIENIENRGADNESRRTDTGKREDRGRAGGDVYLRKVRLENELKAAGGKSVTEGERAELGRIRELWAAGAEALKNGARGDAAGLFAKAEESLGAWKSGVTARKAKEREEEAARSKAEEERRRAEAERRSAAERAAREKQAAEERSAAERRAAERARSMARVRKLVGWLVVGGLLCWGVAAGVGKVRWSEESRKAREAAEKRVAEGAEKSVDLGGGVSLEMVACPGGLWMGKYEVTQEQWESVMGNNPSSFKGDNLPVETVSWNDCQDFVGKLNATPGARASGLTFRLPTEEEWETACRAGAPKSADYCKLADGTQITEKTLSKVARYGKGWDDGPVAVGSFLPNAWGLYDMHGNVGEWTSTADGGNRVFRGGSFDFTAVYCTAGYRFWDYPDVANRLLGLRLAASGRAAAR